MDSVDAPMIRPSVKEAENEIGVKHPVLQHGYVVLVDYMGNDSAIVQAARVSYGAGTKSVRDDRGLIRYLLRHRHTTPFEMVEFKFLVRLPIFVARQWIRHRTACLAQGTRVYFDLPGGVRRKGNQLYSLRIEDLWQRFLPTRNQEPSHQRNPHYRKERVERMLVRQLNEDRRIFGHSHVVGVSKNGLKPVFRMVLDDGKSIDCTADHRFLFQEGWKTLAEQTGLREERGRAVWDRGEYLLNINGAELLRPALYHDRDWLEEAIVRRRQSVADIAEVCGVEPKTILQWCHRHGLILGPSDECHQEVHRNEKAYIGCFGSAAAALDSVRSPRVVWNRLIEPRLARVESFEFLGDRMTYDLEVEAPFHNFVANGIVTHNSVNEYSARYSIVPDEYEVPPPEEVRHQSTRQRQGRGDPLPVEVTERFRADLGRISKDAYSVYQAALDGGVARETARLVLPVAYYTQWYWKIDLYNLLHFLSLRLDPHSQEEIRLYAAELAKLTRLVCPTAYEAFEDFALHGLTLGRKEQRAIRALLAGSTPEVACAQAGLPLVREDGKPMTSGEGVEFLEKLERIRHLN